MYSPVGNAGNGQQRVTFDSPPDIDNAQQRLERQYLDQSLGRQPQSEMRRWQPVDSEYIRAYGTPEGRGSQETVLRSKNTLGQIPFSGSTAYKDHYQNHPYEAFSLNPELYRLAVPDYPQYPQPPRIRFEGESTYKAAYRNSDLMDRMRVLNSEKISRKDYWSQQNVPFTGSSSYKAHFQPFQVESRRDPPSGLQPHPVRFEGKTTYKTDFQSFKVELPKRCEVESLPVPLKNTAGNSRHLYYDAIHNRFE